MLIFMERFFLLLEPPQYCMVTENDICNDRVKQFIAEDINGTARMSSEKRQGPD